MQSKKHIPKIEGLLLKWFCEENCRFFFALAVHREWFTMNGAASRPAVAGRATQRSYKNTYPLSYLKKHPQPKRIFRHSGSTACRHGMQPWLKQRKRRS